MRAVVATLSLELLVLATFNIISFGNVNSYLGCIDTERQALLKFRQDLIDPSNRLASWTEDRDCCTWAGVACDNLTGHVLELHLRNPTFTGETGDERSSLGGKINPSLLHLKFLNYLDLSGNNFEGVQIPSFLGSMVNLKYLNLRYSQFVGMIPHQIGNLSNLRYLDLSLSFTLHTNNLLWLSGLSLLEHLDLSFVNLSQTSDWLQLTDALPSLKVLQLTGCELSNFPLKPIANFSSLVTLDLAFNRLDNSLITSWVFGLSRLVYLDLGSNNFQGPIPDGLQNLTSLRDLISYDNQFNSLIPKWLFNFTQLEDVDLGKNSLQGLISDDLENMTSMQFLDLSFNGFEGGIPGSLGRLCKLKSINFSGLKLHQNISDIFYVFSSGCALNALQQMDFSNSQLFGHLTNEILKFKHLNFISLSDNSISGPIPMALREFSSLKYLDLSNNKFNGTLSEFHFTNLTRLKVFYASGNSLTFKVSSDWIPPFQLRDLDLRSCHLGPKIPLWLHSQKQLVNLDISNSRISDIVPIWFWKHFSLLNYLNLSHDQIRGKIPNLNDEATLLQSVDLSSNNLSGQLPLISPRLIVVDLSNNGLSGSVSHFFSCGMNDSKLVQFLKIGGNLLSGELPDCWMNWNYLIVLDLSDNKFIGTLPTSMGSLNSLRSLHLRKNNFSGSIPLSLKNCTDLVVLDVAENKFSGKVPKWIGEAFPRLRILNLRSNKFHGLLPIELCHLVSLQILDLASNDLFGTIPRCIDNLTAMVTMNYSVGNYIQYESFFSFPGKYLNISEEFVEYDSLIMKGKADEYNRILNLVRMIDFSSNNFSGEIPLELTNLAALQSLNLSYNLLRGKIPANIGAMRSIESIDFSTNQLSGEIPHSISSLTFLHHFNLSNNNLIGKIPSSTQLQTFDASCFTGNELCGPPLPQNCTERYLEKTDLENGDIDGYMHSFYVSMAVGLVVGFLSFIVPLIVNRRWRYMYWHFLDYLRDKLIW